MMNIIKKATNNQKAIAVALLVSVAQFAMADGFGDANAAATKFRIRSLQGCQLSVA